MIRATSIVCAITACVLLGLTVYSAYYSDLDPPPPPFTTYDEERLFASPDESSIVLENADQVLGDLPQGTHTVVFHIRNRSSNTGEVVGGTSGCRETCCFEMGAGCRLPVPSRSTISVSGVLTVTGPGAFEFNGALFLKDNGRLRATQFTLRGVGILKEADSANPLS